jgi:hypothetical protein
MLIWARRDRYLCPVRGMVKQDEMQAMEKTSDDGIIMMGWTLYNGMIIQHGIFASS